MNKTIALVLAMLDRAMSRLGSGQAWTIVLLLLAFFAGLGVVCFGLMAHETIEKERSRLYSIATLEAQEVDVWLS